MISALLGWPCATAVIKEKISENTKQIYVEREIESGYKDIIEIILPAVLTIQSGINEPRYPTLTHMLKAKREKPEVIHAHQLEQLQTLQIVKEISYPQKVRTGTVIEGDPKDKAKQLFSILNKKSII